MSLNPTYLPTPTINHLKNKANQNKTKNQVTRIKMVLIAYDYQYQEEKLSVQGWA